MCQCAQATKSKTALTLESHVLGRFVWVQGAGQIKKEGKEKFPVGTNVCSFFILEHTDIFHFPDSFEVWCSHVAKFRPIECKYKWYELFPGLVYRDNHVHSSLSLPFCSNCGDGTLPSSATRLRNCESLVLHMEGHLQNTFLRQLVYDRKRNFFSFY